MITRIEKTEYKRGGLEIWHIVRYILFGFIPIFTRKTKVR